MIESATHLGAAIRERRVLAGLTQVQLAAKANVSSRTLITIEKGHPRAELAGILALLRALDLSIELVQRPPDTDPTDLLDLAGSRL